MIKTFFTLFILAAAHVFAEMPAEVMARYERDEREYLETSHVKTKTEIMETWLRNTSAYLVVGLFKGVGIEISCEGPDIFSPNKEWGYTVVLECAGLKSVRVLAFMAFFYGIWRVHKFHKAFLLALLSVPIAFFINVLRLVLVVGVGYGCGQEASNSIHIFSGYLTFPVAIFTMVGIAEIMKKGVRKTLKNLLKKMTGQDLRKNAIISPVRPHSEDDRGQAPNFANKIKK